MGRKYIVLFGAGKIGKMVCEMMKDFCDEKYLLFCDNSPGKANTKILGIDVCSFVELVELYNEGQVSRIIISVGWTCFDEILIQCLESDISLDVLWTISEQGEIIRPEKIYAFERYSQWGEDSYVANYFEEKDNVVYVDVGANHPYRFSNTYWVYKNRGGGKCINIEPDVSNYNKLCKLRSKDINLNVGISDRKDELKYYAYEETAYNTFSKERMLELRDLGMECEVLNVPVIPLQEILDQYNVSHIDFMDLDVEGMEIKVLNGIDFKKTWIDIMLIEQLNTSLRTVLESDVCSYMREKGFYPVSKYDHTVVYKNTITASEFEKMKEG